MSQTVFSSQPPASSAFLRADALFERGHSAAWPLLDTVEYPWQALAGIREFIRRLGPVLDPAEYNCPCEGVWVHKTAVVAPTAFLGPDVIVGPGAEVRHGAFIRGSALIGAEAVVGNSTELKNVVLFDRVQAPHYNYVGDSILGFRAHMGAGAVTSNVKSDKTPVAIACGDERIMTGLKKCGAILGDRVEVGCGSVLNPGTVIGPDCRVYPLSSVRGFLPAGHLYKQQGEVVRIRE